jgi:hypothetical protein
MNLINIGNAWLSTTCLVQCMPGWQNFTVCAEGTNSIWIFQQSFLISLSVITVSNCFFPLTVSVYLCDCNAVIVGGVYLCDCNAVIVGGVYLCECNAVIVGGVYLCDCNAVIVGGVTYVTVML